jgi:CheY-like chemotaxis protein
MTSIQDLKGKGESILVVDDIEEQRQIATEMLEKLDYTVTTVSTGEEAVEYLRHHTVDLLVLDMIMEPGIDGFETYRRIIELRPDQKAIIASGFSETIRVKETQNLGAGAYIKKPYLLEKIGRAIKAELIK